MLRHGQSVWRFVEPSLIEAYGKCLNRSSRLGLHQRNDGRQVHSPDKNAPNGTSATVCSATASRSAASSSASASVSLLNGFVKPWPATSDNRKYWSFLHNTLSEVNFPAPGGCTQLGQAGTIDPLPIALELWRKSRSHPR